MNDKIELCPFQHFKGHNIPLYIFSTGIDWQVRAPPVHSGGAESARSFRTTGFNRSLANLLILRGKDVFSAEAGKQFILNTPAIQDCNIPIFFKQGNPLQLIVFIYAYFIFNYPTRNSKISEKCT